MDTVHIHLQFSSIAQSCPTLWDPMDCRTPGSLSITNSRSLLKLMSIKSVMPSNHLILCRPLLLPPSTQRLREVRQSPEVTQQGDRVGSPGHG